MGSYLRESSTERKEGEGSLAGTVVQRQVAERTSQTQVKTDESENGKPKD